MPQHSVYATQSRADYLGAPKNNFAQTEAVSFWDKIFFAAIMQLGAQSKLIYFIYQSKPCFV